MNPRFFLTFLFFFLCHDTAFSQQSFKDILSEANHLRQKENNTAGSIDLLDSTWQVCKREINTPDSCLNILSYLSFYYRIGGDFDESIDHYLKLIEYDETGTHHSKAYNYISQSLNRKKNHILALEMAEKGFHHPMINCKWKHNLAHTAAKSITFTGDSSLYEMGIGWIDTSLHYYGKCGQGNPRVISNRLADKGSLLQKQGHLDESMTMYFQAYALLKDNDQYQSEQYRLLNNLGSSHAKAGSLDSAMDFYTRAIELHTRNEWDYLRENLGVLFRNIARIKIEQQNFNAGLQYLERSSGYLNISLKQDSSLLAAIYSDMIRTEQEKLDLYLTWFSKNADLNDKIAAYESGKTIFTQYLALRDMVAADQSKMIGLDELKYSLDQFIQLCIDLDKKNEVFYVCEKLKYQNLLEHLQLFGKETYEEVALKMQLNSISPDGLRSIMNSRNSKEYFFETELAQFGQRTEQLQNESIYSYYQLDDKYLLTRYKQGDIRIQLLSESKIIDSLATLYLKEIQGLMNTGQTANLLFSELFPYKESQDSTMIIIPHGLLSKIPFSSLQQGDQYLIEKTEIVYKKSLFIVDSISSNNGSTVIQPGYQSGLNRKLPFADKEAKYLKTKYGFNALREQDATLSNISRMNSTQNILHFAGHCKTDAENYHNSFLVLDQNEKIGPIDILKLAPNSNLLVLSACSTSDGEFDLAEGLRGISYFFNITGNNNQISTNWSIDDESTFNMLTSFYDKLSAGHSVGKSLRLAQVEHLEKASKLLSHPYFWAGIRYEGNQNLKIELAAKKTRKNYWLAFFPLLFLAAIYLFRKKTRVIRI